MKMSPRRRTSARAASYAARAAVRLRVPERARELERALAPLDRILEQLDRLGEVLSRRRTVDAPLREAELEQDPRPLVGRRRFLERAAEVRHRRVRGTSGQ